MKWLHLLAFVGTLVLLLGADSPSRLAVQNVEGRVVSVVDIHQGQNGRIVMSEKASNTRRLLSVPARATVTLNQNAATLGELRKEDRVDVQIDTYAVVTEINAFRSRRSVGKSR